MSLAKYGLPTSFPPDAPHALFYRRLPGAMKYHHDGLALNAN